MHGYPRMAIILQIVIYHDVSIARRTGHRSKDADPGASADAVPVMLRMIAINGVVKDSQRYRRSGNGCRYMGRHHDTAGERIIGDGIEADEIVMCHARVVRQQNAA